ncbi:hypothetical protein AGLY_004836 [Aphis glycines]|uniref:Uncharacterized protein n=1 Tax=Aphis glycines TaxID=307491 RepID=A0A6G0TVE7_APHGL|nr:hypothetical protein AGLY_004836 [Aphis glycines]
MYDRLIVTRLRLVSALSIFGTFCVVYLPTEIYTLIGDIPTIIFIDNGIVVVSISFNFGINFYNILRSVLMYDNLDELDWPNDVIAVTCTAYLSPAVLELYVLAFGVIIGCFDVFYINCTKGVQHPGFEFDILFFSIDSERSDECIDFTMIYQKHREKQKKNDGKTVFFTQNQFSTESIFLYGCNSKTNHCKYLKFSPNVYGSVIYIHVDKIFLALSKYLKILYKVPHMHNFFLLAFEVQILTKIRQNHEYFSKFIKLFIFISNSDLTLLLPCMFSEFKSIFNLIDLKSADDSNCGGDLSHGYSFLPLKPGGHIHPVLFAIPPLRHCEINEIDFSLYYQMDKHRRLTNALRYSFDSNLTVFGVYELMVLLSKISSRFKTLKSIDNVHCDSSSSKYDIAIHILIEFLCFHFILKDSSMVLAFHKNKL